FGLESVGLNDGAARAGGAGSQEIAQWSLVSAGSEDAAFAGKMFTNGAGKDFDAVLRKIEVRRADHQTGDVFRAHRKATLLHDRTTASRFDLCGNNLETFITRGA